VFAFICIFTPLIWLLTPITNFTPPIMLFFEEGQSLFYRTPFLRCLTIFSASLFAPFFFLSSFELHFLIYLLHWL
jgi:hypothetical protein